ncbi:hypothetical protein BTVI_35822 [Pitangus sulphuratus]|nr:hypothetical protein BTVI_35822 [Pitangus sulphuratus]
MEAYVLEDILEVESFILDQDDLENPMLETASKLLLSSTADGADLRTVDPETQARLEALLEAAGGLGRGVTDGEGLDLEQFKIGKIPWRCLGSDSSDVRLLKAGVNMNP